MVKREQKGQMRELMGIVAAAGFCPQLDFYYYSANYSAKCTSHSMEQQRPLKYTNFDSSGW